MSELGVRRAKAALSSGCKPHPATAPAGSNRSSHGGNEVAETHIAFGSPSMPVHHIRRSRRKRGRILEGLADLNATPPREAELIVIFEEATRLEADFWE